MMTNTDNNKIIRDFQKTVMGVVRDGTIGKGHTEGEYTLKDSVYGKIDKMNTGIRKGKPSKINFL